ncbi:MAG: serine/threonine protein kinase [Deltaproteobacteria bacterium]|nr:serine/threonine protein kinase [Deltaproteobacteria bacterium]
MPLPLTPRAPHPLEGRTAGRYRVRELVGQGGMASVLRAERLDPAEGEGRWVALKVMHPHLARDPREVERFIKEIALCARLKHPNVCPILDLGEVDGAPFLVMPYIEGAPLSALAPPALPPPPPEALATLLVELGRALSYAHQLTDAEGRPLRLVHRDISPHNVVIERSGVAQLLDFGVARVARAGRSTVSDGGEGLVGKLAYMSPERVEEEPFDERADVWSLAVTAWELATGRALFEAPQPMRLMYQVLSAPLAPPSSLRPALPAVFDHVIMAGLARDPAQRPADAARWTEPLDAWLAERGLSILDGRAHVSAWLSGEEAPEGREGEATAGASTAAGAPTAPLLRAPTLALCALSALSALSALTCLKLRAQGGPALRPVLLPTGTLTVRASCVAEVSAQSAAGARALGQTPLSVQLAAGVYELRLTPVSADAPCAPRRRLVEIKEGQRADVDVTLAP